MLDLSQRKMKAFHEATLRLAAKREESKTGEALVKGTLKKIMSNVEEEYNLPPNTLNVQSIYSRLRKNRNLTPNSRGPRSPLADLEDLLVKIFIERAAIN